MSDRERDELDHARALAAMAEGRDDAAPPSDEEAPGDGAPLLAAPATPGGALPASPTFTLAEKKAREARFARGQRHSFVHQYQKTMVPLLIVLAAALVAVGLMCLAMAGGVELFGVAGASVRRKARLIALCAIPLAALLGFGAWWFHAEVVRREGR